MKHIVVLKADGIHASIHAPDDKVFDVVEIWKVRPDITQIITKELDGTVIETWNA